MNELICATGALQLHRGRIVPTVRTCCSFSLVEPGPRPGHLQVLNTSPPYSPPPNCRYGMWTANWQWSIPAGREVPPLVPPRMLHFLRALLRSAQMHPSAARSANTAGKWRPGSWVLRALGAG